MAVDHHSVDHHSGKAFSNQMF
ncbi:hypothetical protein CCACVL1_02982 [Corchorus capsularis]|uniref:Uncharacterized protein n=1 Tax=Corchorus capsularis TaxID=210143 RepID=A0A1R3K492_COCAP|nr:hypothetical protein CCACVL1_02982 [Corchorus capsularis]